MKARDAASLIVLDRRHTEPRFLMGRRAAKHAFMPNVYVFPGGRVDYGDRFAPFVRDYHPDTLDLLLQQMSGRPTALRARMLALAAIRETWEEVGLRLAVKNPAPRRHAQTSWREFSMTGLAPDLAEMHYVARAITPPGNSRRFDTRFFIFDASRHLEHQNAASSPELEDVRWVSLDEATALAIHPITARVLDIVRRTLYHPSFGKNALPVPFFRAEPGDQGRLVKRVTVLHPGREPEDGGLVTLKKA